MSLDRYQDIGKNINRIIRAIVRVVDNRVWVIVKKGGRTTKAQDRSI
jgi:hypothetical protein